MDYKHTNTQSHDVNNIKDGMLQEEEKKNRDIKSSSISNKNKSINLKIKPIDTSKDRIRHPLLSEHNIIPRLGTSSIFNGTTGMGKSTLLTNLVVHDHFLGSEDVFDFKILISPTAEGDDVQKKLGIEEAFTVTDLREAPAVLARVMKVQKEAIKKKGNDNAPQVLLIYDDVISDPLFMRTDEFIKSFIASRHYNFTTMLCSQSWTSCPRKCRLQAKNIFFFASPQSEMELLALEYSPPGMTKKEFIRMVQFATDEPYSFLYINKSVPMQDRFRKNLDEMIDISYFKVKENEKRNIRRSERPNKRLRRTVTKNNLNDVEDVQPSRHDRTSHEGKGY